MTIRAARDEQVKITDALLSEAKRKGVSAKKLCKRMGKAPSTVYTLRAYKDIGIHTFLDAKKALNVKMALINEEGEMILCL